MLGGHRSRADVQAVRKKNAAHNALVCVCVVSVLFALTQGTLTTIVGAQVLASTSERIPGEARSTHAPIHINGNTDFATQATSEGWAGDGSAGSPYVISGYEISAGGGSYCILIENTDVYFIIKNCNLTNATGSSTTGAVHFNQVSNGTIMQCNITANNIGVYAYRSWYNNISDNNISSNSGNGLYLWNASCCIVSNNTINPNVNYGIYVRDSINLNINNNTISKGTYGIELSHVNDTVLVQNIINGSSYGLSAGYSANITIRQCSITNNSQYGIKTTRSESIEITLNTIIKNYNYGVAMYYTNNSRIQTNTISNSTYDVYLNASNSVVITHNTLANTTTSAIALISSMATSIVGNTITDGGIYIEGALLEHWNTHLMDATNLIAGRPLRYHANQTGMTVPNDAGQVILANCSNMFFSGSWGIKNIYTGVLLGFSDNNTIERTLITENEIGVALYASHYNRIRELNATKNTYYGIYLRYSDYNTITNNTLTFCGQGVFLQDSMHSKISGNNASGSNRGIYLVHADFTEITDNIVRSHSDAGIRVIQSNESVLINNDASAGSVFGFYPYIAGIYISNSENLSVVGNNMSGNYAMDDEFGMGTGMGLYIESSKNIKILNNNASGNVGDSIMGAGDGYGMYLSACSYITISGNNVSDNSGGTTGYGIYLSNTFNSTITYNNISHNHNEGVYLFNSEANAIHHNNFWSNNGATRGISDGHCQAYDNCGNNTWYDSGTHQGNYWSNWDGNGWGTTNAYPIFGSNGTADIYPLNAPIVNEDLGLPMLLLCICLLLTLNSMRIRQREE
jgi:parallel beta-helix repeat protein